MKEHVNTYIPPYIEWTEQNREIQQNNPHVQD